MGKAFGFISKMLGKKQDKVALHSEPQTLSAPKVSYEITPEIRAILDTVKERSGTVIFVTGAAGTGKSTLIEILRTETSKNVVVVAPTGVAALNSGGQTIHSFFRLAPQPQPKPQKIRGMNGLVMTHMDILVIDEVSMVRADLMDAISASLRLNINNQSHPFGGKTVVLIGDMHQLPPIVASEQERLLFAERYDTPYFFSAESLHQIEPVTKLLTKSFRQKNQAFVDLLNSIRTGTDIDNAINMLNDHCYRPGQEDNSLLTLTPINAKADAINLKRINEIDNPPHTYEAELEGKWGERDSQLPAPKTLTLKVGAQVMFVKNGIDWVNGTIGTVIELDDDNARVRLETGATNREVTLQRATWEQLKFTWDPDKKKISTKTVGTYKQLPFRLAWAITIHKAQGLTLDSVTIDLDRGTFAAGQAYVALSRCRTLKGLTLSRPLKPEDIKLDDNIVGFYRELDA